VVQTVSSSCHSRSRHWRVSTPRGFGFQTPLANPSIPTSDQPGQDPYHVSDPKDKISFCNEESHTSTLVYRTTAKLM
jgi:hypothetical protein